MRPVRARFVVPFFAIVTTVVMIAVAARLDADSGHPKTGSGNREAGLTGIHKIQHVIFIVQENRSFDNYFGTYPGADGIPRKDGRFTVCVSDQLSHSCIRPFHDTHDCDIGGPHSTRAMTVDIHNGKMDGYVGMYRVGSAGLMHGSVVISRPCRARASPNNLRPDVRGFHTRQELPNYWAYAHRYVLQDHMFESSRGSSLSSHLYMVSGVVGRLFPPDESWLVQERAGRPGKAGRGLDARDPRIRLDRPHVAAPRGGGVVGILRGAGNPA